MEKNIETIDMNLYRRTGEGACGASYDCIDDPSQMVKMYNEGFPEQAIIDELEVARKVFDAGVKSPEPGRLVTDGKRLGIAFRKIEGKRSFSRMFADEPERTEEYARELARLAKGLHSIECPEGVFPDAKELSLEMLDALTDITDGQRTCLKAIIDEIPECRTALHGDFHFGNVVSTLPKGAPLSAPHECFFIDLGNFSSGCPMLDIAMLTSICEYATEEYIFHDMHIHKSHAHEVLTYFLDEYFFSDDRLGERMFGKGADINTVLNAIRPYYCVKAIMIDYSIGHMLDESIEAINEEMKLRGIPA